MGTNYYNNHHIFIFFFFLSFTREQFFFSADNDCDEGNELTLGKITFWETKLKKKK